MNKICIFIVATLYILSANAYSEINNKSWTKICDEKNKIPATPIEVLIKNLVKSG